MQSYGGAPASAAPQQLPYKEQQPQRNLYDATLRNSSEGQQHAGGVIRGSSNSSGENSRCESDDEYNRNQPRSAATAPLTAATAGGAVGIEAANKGPNVFAPHRAHNTGGVEASELPSSSNNMEGSSPMASYNEERMRRKLQFFFMNPIEKWQARRKFPYKFVVQVVKIILVTVQLCLFAHSRYNHINYTWDNRIAFSHLFLRGWDSSREVESYPPSVGPFALYEKSDFYNTIDYAVRGYANMSRSIGPYDYPTDNNEMAPLHLCLYNYREGTIFGFNESYIFNPDITEFCLYLPPNVTKMGVQAYLKQSGVELSFSSLVKATLVFAIKTVNFKAYGGPLSAPDCFKFDVSIIFDNRDHDGQMLLSLDADAQRLRCKGDVEFFSNAEFDAALRSMLNILVLMVCLLSFALCSRALYRAYLLRCQTVNFFRMHFNKELSFDGHMEFVNFWYVMIIINDLLLIIGSSLKEQIERKFLVVDQWDTCSLFLGIGNLLVWFGVLRYLGFFKTYNVVILTLKKAAPKILRFLLAALLIYAGFTFCGWLILGPYHMKFRSLATTSECLFALINGDDMFATFATLSSKADWLWWFCQIYLYSFISLYIYVVLSLFISVIMDAYDTIKCYYRDGFPISDLKAFVGTRNEEDLTSGVFMNNMDDFDGNGLLDVLRQVCCCGRCRGDSGGTSGSNGPSGYTSLTSIIK
ncbi:mucolipin-3-like isoform X1 [Rhagoletis pomonella]|uniref:mucolipin-3-like isoform X1 n=1 Tax=Rhagoletis pomonella TaxID=28610 RepID=UPI001781811B|nr:mucolipin-3-like isoform X1 [Rhagoletis pomonella]